MARPFAEESQIGYGRAGGSPPAQRRSRLIRRHNSLRLKDYDYTQGGAYFITICAYRHAHIFGEIIDGHMYLNDLGRLIQQEWRKTAVVRKAVEVDLHVVMPNHLHGILFIADRKQSSDPNDAKGMRANSLGAIIAQFKSIVTKRRRDLPHPPPPPIWRRNYYDRIVQNERTLEKIRRYILTNLARWQDDEYY